MPPRDRNSPLGYATEAQQEAAALLLDAILARLPELVGGKVPVDAGALGGGGGGGLTDAELRAAPVEVEGTFYPLVQPVSASSLPLPNGASTEARQVDELAFLDAIDTGLGAIYSRLGNGTVHVIVDSMPSGGLTNTELRASAIPVSLASVPSHAVTGPATNAELRAAPLPVSGDFFQATQPVSASALPLPNGAATEATLSTRLTNTELRASPVPVSLSGVATEATLALIKAKTDNLDVALSTRAVTGLTDGQLRAAPVPVSGPVTNAELRASAVPVSVSGVALDATLSALNAKVPGARSSLAYGCTLIAGVVAETILSCIATTDLVAVAAANTYTVPVGKRLRVQSLVAIWRNGTAAAGGVTIRLRAVPSGTANATSPLIASAHASTALATVGSGAMGMVDIPDGFDFPAGASICLTQAAVTTVAGVEARLVGYLY